MSNWLRRIRGAIGLGVTWAVAWAIGGLAIGAASLVFPGAWSEAFFKIFDAPLPALAIPGFLAGALFSVVLGIAGRRHRFEDLSLPRFTVWGAAGGALVSLVPAVMAGVGLATFRPGLSPWLFTGIIIGPLTVFSAASAAASLSLARRAERRVVRPGSTERLEG
jgi:hypothetical protein